MNTNHSLRLFAPLSLFIFIFLSYSSLISDRISDNSPDPENIKVEVSGPILARVYFRDFSELNMLAENLDIWEVNQQSGYALALIHPSHLKKLSQYAYRVEIDNEWTELLNTHFEYLPNQLFGIPGFPCYRTVAETYADLNQLAASNPGLASWIDIGDSWEKVTPGGDPGFDIYALILTNKAIPGPKPRFYLISAIHGREIPTAELAARFAEHLVEKYDTDPDITWLLDHFEVHITPHANPDGRKQAEAGAYWRKNTDNDDGCYVSSLWGTDLNRNSSFKWAGVGSSAAPCDVTYHGPSPASEPETQAIQNYASSIFPDQRGPGDSDPSPEYAEGIFITLHSFGDLVLYPWGWTNDPVPNKTALETLGRKFGFFTGYQVCQSGEFGCLYQTSGSTDDWIYGQYGVAAYTFELGTSHFESCDYFENKILPDNLDALVYALKSAHRPYANPAGPESLDLTLSADHIAPGAGLILNAVADDTRYYSGSKGDEPTQTINAARYSLDQPSWFAGVTTYPLSAADGEFDNPVESISVAVDTSTLEIGRHTIFVESQDSVGNWGVPSAVFIWIGPEEYLAGIVSGHQTRGASSGSVVTHLVEVSNLGTQDDTYTIKLSGNSWQAISSHEFIGPLIPGQSEQLQIDIFIPETAQVGDADTINLRAISRGDPSSITQLILKTVVVEPAAFLPLISR